MPAARVVAVALITINNKQMQQGLRHLDIEVHGDALEQGVRAVYAGVWPEYSSAEQSRWDVRRMTEGITNILFRVRVQGGHTALVRVYGVGTEVMLDRPGEVRRQHALASLGLAAQIFATFRNGCCYEYLEGAPLSHTTVASHAPHVAQELARWHLAHPDDPSDSPLLEPSSARLARKWLALLPAKHPVWKRVPYSHALLTGELDRLMQRLVDSPIRFCHNDILPFNIIVNKNIGDRVRFIDYEYAAFNTRGFDLGNHFNEYAGFDLDFNLYPTRDYQLRFIRMYLEMFYGDPKLVEEQEVKKCFKEANQWSLMSHFLWAVWGLFQASHSTIEFDFLGYSKKRFAIYFRNRDEFLDAPDDHEYKYVVP